MKQQGEMYHAMQAIMARYRQQLRDEEWRWLFGGSAAYGRGGYAMPAYVYECQTEDCKFRGATDERLFTPVDAPTPNCPNCGQPMAKTDRLNERVQELLGLPVSK